MKNKVFLSLLMYLTLIISFSLCSCATKKNVEYVEKEVIKYQKEILHDTLIQHTHDSVFHTIFQKGDTVYDTKYIEKTKWRDKIVYKTDTCYRDSVQVVFKETTIEKKRTPKWCYATLLLCVCLLLPTITKVIQWIQVQRG